METGGNEAKLVLGQETQPNASLDAEFSPSRNHGVPGVLIIILLAGFIAGVGYFFIISPAIGNHEQVVQTFNKSEDINNAGRVIQNIVSPTPFCGDNECNTNETCHSCSHDCGACPAPQTPKCTNQCQRIGQIDGCYSTTHQKECVRNAENACLEYQPIACPGGQLCTNGACRSSSSGGSSGGGSGGGGSSGGGGGSGGTGASCGDSSCNGSETCSNCPGDCGICPGCNNGICSSGENCSSCPADCGTCPPECGNNIQESGETCDGNDLAGQSCISLGFNGGTLSCQADCGDFNTDACIMFACGNNIQQGSEQCDGTDLNQQTCESLGFFSGSLACQADCSDFDTTGCSNPLCGNNQIEGSEECDGTDLGGQTCASRGFDLGSVSCSPGCLLDYSNCSNEIPDGSLQAHIGVDEQAYYHSAPLFADYGMSLTRGYRPFGVFFQGWTSTPRESLVKYAWDFGAGTQNDEGGRYFEGFNAAHVFETPGTYSVKLRVMGSNGQWSDFDTISIEVLDNSGTTYFVDSQIGNDDFDGKCVAINGNCGPWKTASHAFSQMVLPRPGAPPGEWPLKPGDRVLFRRGQVFDSNGQIKVGGTQGYYFGACNAECGNPNDPKPLIQWSGPAQKYMVSSDSGTGYIGFMDLRFQFLGPNGQGEGLFFANDGVKQLVFLRNEFIEPNVGAVGISSNSALDYVPQNASSIFLVSNNIRNVTTNPTSITQVYFFGTRQLAFINNTFDKPGDHIAYLGMIDQGVFSNNVFARPAFGRVGLRITGGHYTSPGNNILISDNRFLGWIDPVSQGWAHNGGGTRYNLNLLELGPNSAHEFALDHIVVERNIFTNCAGCMVIGDIDNLSVHSNIFVSPDFYRDAVINFSAGSFMLRPSRHVRMVNNTFVFNGQSTQGYKPALVIVPYNGATTPFGDRHIDINFSNNILYSVAGRKGIATQFWTLERDLVHNFSSNHNVWFVPATTDSKIFLWWNSSTQFGIDANRYSFENWNPLTGSETDSQMIDPQFTGSIPAIRHSPGEPSLEQAITEAQAYEQAFRLSGNSPRDNGFVWPNDSYYDFTNSARYAGDGKVDRGALEYGS